MTYISAEKPLPLGEQIIKRSTGLFGDFQMPVCANLISTEGPANGWGYQMTDSEVRRILRRYKEHATYWNANQNTIGHELALFDNALARIGLLYPWEEILRLYAEVPAQRAQPFELP